MIKNNLKLKISMNFNQNKKKIQYIQIKMLI